MDKLYQVNFYVPEAQCEQVKKAMFDAGAGILGNYEECAWQTLGEGQFKPLKNSQPFIGKANELERVMEYKVEMICPAAKIEAVIQALKNTHPYEVPAYSVILLSNDIKH